MMNEPIDIVVPWVNPNDSKWVQSFKRYKFIETGIQDECRFRDMNIFNYWFRSVETYCPWVRYIFLILSSNTQIPSWLNTNNTRLKIVYHNEFIPHDELPTFNSSVINCYIPFIKNLSEHYILFNDDMFVVKPVFPRTFFINDKVVGYYSNDNHNKDMDCWSNNLRNGYHIFKACTSIDYCYRPEHGAIPFIKSVNLFTWHKNMQIMSHALHNSKFRQPKNITDWAFFGFHFALDKAVRGPSITDYYNIPVTINPKKQIACFNDNERLNDFNQFNRNVRHYLSNKFTRKSSYEN